jgi:hypothetical protein
MTAIDFASAYYIKLGRGGAWEDDSFAAGRLRFGWREQSVEDINAARWAVIEKQLRAKDGGKRVSATTTDFKALRVIAASGPSDLWITFHKAKLWWARLVVGPVELDAVSKFRRTAGPPSSRRRTFAGCSSLSTPRRPT